MESIQAILAEKTTSVPDQGDSRRKKRRLDSTSSSSSSSSSLVSASTVPRPLSNNLEPDELYVPISKIKGDDWHFWLKLGPQVDEDIRWIDNHTKKEKVLRKSFIPIYRNPESMKLPSVTPQPFRMYIPDVTPDFPLEAKYFAEHKKYSMSFQIGLHPTDEKRVQLQKIHEGKQNFLESMMKKHPDLKERAIEGFHLNQLVHVGKMKTDGSRYDSFLRFNIKRNKTSKKFEYTLFLQGEELLPDITPEKYIEATSFIASPEVRKYKCHIGVGLEQLSLLSGTKNIFPQEFCHSIHLPKPIPPYTKKVSTVLPGCRLNSDSSSSTSSKPNDDDEDV